MPSAPAEGNGVDAMRLQTTLLTLILALLLGLVGPAGSATGARLAVLGTEFVLWPGDGREIRAEGLVGATLSIRFSGEILRIRVDRAERETAAGGGVMLYGLSLLDPTTGAARELCLPDAKGRSAGFPVPDGEGGFALTCTSGAEGKCILLGYRPWETTPDGPPVRALHRACIHMIRADYGGDGRPTTRDGTTVDVYDRFGVQVPASSLAFEAAWGSDGAVCVARPRIEENISLDEIAARYRHLAGALGRRACNDELAPLYPGALLFNRSGGSPER